MLELVVKELGVKNVKYDQHQHGYNTPMSFFLSGIDHAAVVSRPTSTTSRLQHTNDTIPKTDKRCPREIRKEGRRRFVLLLWHSIILFRPPFLARITKKETPWEEWIESESKAEWMDASSDLLSMWLLRYGYKLTTSRWARARRKTKQTGTFEGHGNQSNIMRESCTFLGLLLQQAMW